jgi:chorismate mutase/prephenate dehydratase
MAEIDQDSTAQLESSIDDVDLKILALLDQRAELVRQLCQHDSGPLVGRVVNASQRIGKLVIATPQSTSISSELRADALRHISSTCLQSLHRMRVTYLGPMHSYSHLAALKFFGDAVALTPVATIPAVFESVSRGDATTGIVPIENSTDGRVVDTLGMFVRNREMQICGEAVLPIHHHLLSRTPRNEITEVHSKPQALSQCRRWLASQLPQAKLVEVSSTATAAKLAAEQHGVAAVASIQAGRQYALDVIDSNIEDNPHNVTRFAVLGTEMPSPTGDDKTALLFQVSHQPGALADAMTIFKNQALNLTWIESFPAPETKNEYLFFTELTGHRQDPPVKAAIEQLQSQTQRLTILGSYPRAHLD